MLSINDKEEDAKFATMIMCTFKNGQYFLNSKN